MLTFTLDYLINILSYRKKIIINKIVFKSNLFKKGQSNITILKGILGISTKLEITLLLFFLGQISIEAAE